MDRSKVRARVVPLDSDFGRLYVVAHQGLAHAAAQSVHTQLDYRVFPVSGSGLDFVFGTDEAAAGWDYLGQQGHFGPEALIGTTVLWTEPAPGPSGGLGGMGGLMLYFAEGWRLTISVDDASREFLYLSREIGAAFEHYLGVKLTDAGDGRYPQWEH